MYRLLIALVCATGAATGCQEKVPQPRTAPADTVPLTFNVEQNPTIEFEIPAFRGVECCEGASDVLAEVAGVVDVYASDRDKRVIVAIDQATFDREAAKTALETKFGPVQEVADPSLDTPQAP
jgi:hypothetical protein